jgi:GT2 family glycosyltransferase/glycosyltransferase involved in cell wall biosynthesis
MPDAVSPLPLVSVVLLNYKGADDTITCLHALTELDYPAELVEVICVDNASGDDSVTRIRAVFPDLRLVESTTNTGFTGGCNLGAEKATGKYVAFLNNDAKPHPRWLSAAVTELEAQPDVGAVASKVLTWDGDRVDYVGGELTWYGMGYKKEVGAPDDSAFDTPRNVLFGTGAALVTRRELFLSTGGFDERFFMFFEDVDYGWRLNLLGWRVRYVPTSIAYHRHHASMKAFGTHHEDFLLDRNALLTIYKNFSDDVLTAALPAAMALTARRSVVRGGMDPESLDLRRASENRSDTETVSRAGLAGLYALDSFTELLPSMQATRAEIQSQRRRSEADILPLFGDSLRSMQSDPRTLEGYEALVRAFGVAKHLQQRRRILIITGDRLSKAMAGPAIRAWNIALALGREHDVRLVSTNHADITSPLFEVAVAPFHNSRSMIVHEEWADVILLQGYALSEYKVLQDSTKIMICDLYDPMHLEQLEQARELGHDRWTSTVASATDVLNDQLRRGDFFLCASERQRHFWLGQLAAVGRINPENYAQDESLDRLIDVVPFGMADNDPVQTRHAIKGTVPGIGPDDKVIVWGGGVYNWFDPVSLVEAIGQLAQRRPDVRLFFLGMKHPNPHVPQMRAATEAQARADELGLTDTHVFFNREWVDYDDRQNYLLDSDVGVSTHYEHVETTFSFRTRILDYLWAELPIVTTDGDSFGELVRTRGLGVAVGANNVTELAEALEIALYDDAFAERARGNIALVRRELTWSGVLAPLVEFCRDPRPAADRLAGLSQETEADRQWKLHVQTLPAFNLRGDVALYREYLRAGGIREVATRAQGRVKRVISRGPAS